MPSETIHIRFSDKVDGSRGLARVATDIAFDFSTTFPDRPSGYGHNVPFRWSGYIWSAWWTKARAVVVRCEYEAADARP